MGIGLTRGSACCIYKEEQIIDYSGKVLNHSSRLMNKARPSGLICDYGSVIGVLKPELLELFGEDAICLRGISEKEPIKILYLKNHVIINDQDRKPLKEPVWNLIEKFYKFGIIKKLPGLFRFLLNKKPLRNEDFLLEVSIPRYINGVRVKGISTYKYYNLKDDELTYSKEGRKHIVTFNMRRYIESIDKSNIPPDDINVRFEIKYPV